MSNEAPHIDPELDELLWTMAGVEFTGLDNEALTTCHKPEVRDRLFGRAALALDMARELDPAIQATNDAKPALFAKVLGAVLNGKPPSSVIPERSYRGPGRLDDKPNDKALVIRTARYLRTLNNLLDLPAPEATKPYRKPDLKLSFDFQAVVAKYRARTDTIDSFARDEPVEEESTDTEAATTILKTMELAVPDGTYADVEINELAKIASQTHSPQVTAALFAKTVPLIVRFCRKRVYREGSTAADDVAQEAVTALFEALSKYQYQEGAKFTSYAYGIAHNKVADYYRALNRRREDSFDISTVTDTSFGTMPSAETLAIADIKDERLQALLGCLSQQQLDVIILRLVVELSGKQIAEILGTTEGSVRVTQHRALTKMRGRVVEYGFTAADGLPLNLSTLLKDPVKSAA